MHNNHKYEKYKLSMDMNLEHDVLRYRSEITFRENVAESKLFGIQT